jgi:hypothetical protein
MCEERVRAFWRILFQLALYAGAIAFSRLVAPSIWVALYRWLVDAEAIVRPTSPTSLFVAVQVALLLVVLSPYGSRLASLTDAHPRD